MRVLGNEVTIGSVSGRAQLNAPTERVIDGMAITTGWELEYLIADYPQIRRGALIVVDGVNYVAREDGMIRGDQATGMVLLESIELTGRFIVTHADFRLITEDGRALVTS